MGGTLFFPEILQPAFFSRRPKKSGMLTSVGSQIWNYGHEPPHSYCVSSNDILLSITPWDATFRHPVSTLTPCTLTIGFPSCRLHKTPPRKFQNYRLNSPNFSRYYFPKNFSWNFPKKSFSARNKPPVRDYPKMPHRTFCKVPASNPNIRHSTLKSRNCAFIACSPLLLPSTHLIAPGDMIIDQESSSTKPPFS